MLHKGGSAKESLAHWVDEVKALLVGALIFFVGRL
jgi:hypothetical protein